MHVCAPAGATIGLLLGPTSRVSLHESVSVPVFSMFSDSVVYATSHDRTFSPLPFKPASLHSIFCTDFAPRDSRMLVASSAPLLLLLPHADSDNVRATAVRQLECARAKAYC